MPDTLAEEIARLPATPGITYRGMSGPPPVGAFAVSAVLPTSADPRIASENFTSERVAAIVTITGRSIAPLSSHPDELEIAILPGTLLLPAGSVAIAELPNPVVLLTETGWAPGLPEDSQALKQAVVEQVSRALAGSPAAIHSPGRFTPPHR
jgi:hypothetical protein